jgi:hypothetical protein
VIIKHYVNDNGTLIELESEDQIREWDIEQLTMEQNPAFRKKVKKDCKRLHAGVKHVNETIDGLISIYNDLTDFIKDYEEEHPKPKTYYDYRYPFSPSRVRALEKLLQHLINMIEEYWKAPFPYKYKGKRTASLSLSTELTKLSSMTPQERTEYLRDQPQLTEAWLLDMLEKRRKKEAQYKTEQRQEAINRYRSQEKLATKESYELNKAEEDLRGILKAWMHQKQTQAT